MESVLQIIEKSPNRNNFTERRRKLSSKTLARKQTENAKLALPAAAKVSHILDVQKADWC